MVGDVVLTWSRGELAALELADGSERWRVELETRPAIMGCADGVVALGPRAGGLLPAGGRSLATGEARWERKVSSQRHVSYGERLPERLLRVEAVGERILLTRVSVGDGSERRLLDAPLPSAYREAEFVLVIDDLEERETAGLVVIRGSAPRIPGTQGTPMGDLVLRPGAAKALTLHERPVNALTGPADHQFATPGDAHHLLLTPSAPDTHGASLLCVGEGVRWTRSGATRLLMRRPGMTVVTGVPHRHWFVPWRPMPEVSAVEDDGSVRWCRTGPGVLAREDEAWILDLTELIGVGVEDGAVRWRCPIPEPPGGADWRHSNGLRGYRDEDRHLLLTRPDALLAYG